MRALASWTMHHRNATGFRISVNATAKAARQAHQARVVQRLLRSDQGLPPHPETAGLCEKNIQYDPIDTIVAAGQPIPHTDHSTNLACFADKHAPK
jgi:hypothetical protein